MMMMSVSAADYCGEHLAWFFGITSPKYQYILDEYKRQLAQVSDVTRVTVVHSNSLLACLIRLLWLRRSARCVKRRSSPVWLKTTTLVTVTVRVIVVMTTMMSHELIWLAVWLSGNALASINVVALRQTRLVLGWVTVCKPFRYVISQLGQLSLSSLWGR